VGICTTRSIQTVGFKVWHDTWSYLMIRIIVVSQLSSFNRIHAKQFINGIQVSNHTVKAFSNQSKTSHPKLLIFDLSQGIDVLLSLEKCIHIVFPVHILHSIHIISVTITLPLFVLLLRNLTLPSAEERRTTSCIPVYGLGDFHPDFEKNVKICLTSYIALMWPKIMQLPQHWGWLGCLVRAVVLVLLSVQVFQSSL